MKNNLKKIAVTIPCHNEAVAISGVVSAFANAIPEADIFVYDNVSTDGTAEIAKKSGAIVCTEPNKGKGNVVRRMFADIDADIYVIVDGDGTYDASKCSEMIRRLVDNNLDMVTATRKAINSKDAYRPGHIFGNWVLTRAVSYLFGHGFTDMLSGYRVMSRRFVKSFPIISKGFEIETEMTIHALQMRVPYEELETMYDSRPEGSESKLSTFKDGLRILKMIFLLFKEERPFQFFGLFSLFLFMISIILAIPIFITYSETGMVPRLPTAILSASLMILSFFSIVSGLILDGLSRSKLEVKRISYLSIK